MLRRIFGPNRDWGKTGVEKTIEGEALCSVPFNKHYLGDQIEKNKMGCASSMYEGEETCIQFWWENLREGDSLEDPSVHGRITLK